MAYNPKTGKGLGRFYDANHRAFRAREWRGFRDTFYDFFRWLYLYGFMAVKLGCHPILMVKAMMRYRWMVSYLTAAHMVDRARQGAALCPQPVLLGSAQLGSRRARHHRQRREPAPQQQAGRKAAREHRDVRRDDPPT